MDFSDLLRIFLIAAAFCLVLALALIVLILGRIRRIPLPADADWRTALRATPLLVVVMLDLLDFSLDFLSAPIAWPLLGRLGLEPLRGITLFEELIPATQFIPTMTLAWLAVRLLSRDRNSS